MSIYEPDDVSEAMNAIKEAMFDDLMEGFTNEAHRNENKIETSE